MRSSTDWLTVGRAFCTVNSMVESLDAVFRALSSAPRRTMLNALAEGERTVGELAEPFEISLAAVSKHLMVLEGNPEYALHFNETDVLSDAQRRYAEQQYTLFKRWYASWSATGDDSRADA